MFFQNEQNSQTMIDLLFLHFVRVQHVDQKKSKSEKLKNGKLKMKMKRKIKKKNENENEK